MSTDPDVRRLEDPQGQLEQALIDEFLRARGHDPAHLDQLPEDERERLLRAACSYAAAKLAEVDTRAHYVHDIHGQ